MKQDIFLPPGVQAALSERFGHAPRIASNRIADALAALWLRRNQAPEEDLEAIDGEMRALGLLALREHPADILGMVKQRFGSRRKISRAEQVELLCDYSIIGGSLVNGYVDGTAPEAFNKLGHVASDEEAQEIMNSQPESYHCSAAEAWMRATQGITVVSVGAHLRDGGARYDQPGSMHPMQQAQVSFVAEGGVGASTLDYLREHCGRLFIVTGEVPPLPEKPAQIITHQCDNGHKWSESAGDACPECGECWV